MPDEPITPEGDSVPASDQEPAGTPAPALAPDGAPSPATDPATPVDTPQDYHSVIGPDGVFLDGWKDQLPEELRHEQVLDTFTDLPGAIKMTVNAQKMIGKDKIAIPGKDAPAEEKDAFQIALGRPVTQDQYALNFPEGFEDRFGAEETKEAAFALGLSQETLDAMVTFRAGEMAAQDAADEAADTAAYEEAEKIVVAQAGEALEEQKILANRLIAAHVPDKTTLPDGTVIDGQQYQENLLEALNDHTMRPWVFNFLANIQRDIYGEHAGIPAGDGSAPGAMTVGMLEAKANELETTTGYLNGDLKNSNPTQYNRLTQEITAIYDRIRKAEKASQ